ncbi:hypothetical protein RN04_11665 [Arthrobacter sp. W1]|nr:hypothetical protein RN04_11665 [Arthrobacter sp. W1]
MALMLRVLLALSAAFVHVQQLGFPSITPKIRIANHSQFDLAAKDAEHSLRTITGNSRSLFEVPLLFCAVLTPLVSS